MYVGPTCARWTDMWLWVVGHLVPPCFLLTFGGAKKEGKMPLMKPKEKAEIRKNLEVLIYKWSSLFSETPTLRAQLETLNVQNLTAALSEEDERKASADILHFLIECGRKALAQIEREIEKALLGSPTPVLLPEDWKQRDA